MSIGCYVLVQDVSKSKECLYKIFRPIAPIPVAPSGNAIIYDNAG